MRDATPCAASYLELTSTRTTHAAVDLCTPPPPPPSHTIEPAPASSSRACVVGCREANRCDTDDIIATEKRRSASDPATLSAKARGHSARRMHNAGSAFRQGGVGKEGRRS